MEKSQKLQSHKCPFLVRIVVTIGQNLMKIRCLSYNWWSREEVPQSIWRSHLLSCGTIPFENASFSGGIPNKVKWKWSNFYFDCCCILEAKIVNIYVFSGWFYKLWIYMLMFWLVLKVVDTYVFFWLVSQIVNTYVFLVGAVFPPSTLLFQLVCIFSPAPNWTNAATFL